MFQRQNKTQEIFWSESKSGKSFCWDRVLVRKVAFDGNHKIADKFEEETYEVVEQPSQEIPVFKVKSASSGNIKVKPVIQDSRWRNRNRRGNNCRENRRKCFRHANARHDVIETANSEGYIPVSSEDQDRDAYFPETGGSGVNHRDDGDNDDSEEYADENRREVD